MEEGCLYNTTITLVSPCVICPSMLMFYTNTNIYQVCFTHQRIELNAKCMSTTSVEDGVLYMMLRILYSSFWLSMATCFVLEVPVLQFSPTFVHFHLVSITQQPHLLLTFPPSIYFHLVFLYLEYQFFFSWASVFIKIVFVLLAFLLWIA